MELHQTTSRQIMVSTVELVENADFTNTYHNITLSYAGTDLSRPKRKLIEFIESVSGKRAIRRAQQRFRSLDTSHETFFRDAAKALQLHVDTTLAPRSYIPGQGPLLVIANHPFGVVDGLAIGAWLEKFRQDLRIIVWDAIDLPSQSTHFLPLDLSGTRISNLRQNVRIRREATQHLRGGGSVLLFPAGSAEVARHPWHSPKEAPWTSMVARLYKDSGADVLPVFVDGHNSRLFHSVHPGHETLRRALFLHETRRRIGSTIRLVAGEVFPLMTDGQKAHDIADTELIKLMRQRTLSLKRYL